MPKTRVSSRLSRVFCFPGSPERNQARRLQAGARGRPRFERDLLIERTQSGLKREQAAGKHCGRPPALSEAERAAVIARLAAGASVASLAKEFNTSRPTIMRIRDSRTGSRRARLY
ncbi:Hin recombinase [Burkholderia sp. Bp8963]|nr:Hin recombinase [Burkholderia sp. Bp8963]